MVGTGRSRRVGDARQSAFAMVGTADGSPDGRTVTVRSTSVPRCSPRGEDECAAVGGLTWSMKAAGSNISHDSPEVGAGTVGRSRPSLGPGTGADPDSGESRWSVR